MLLLFESLVLDDKPGVFFEEAVMREMEDNTNTKDKDTENSYLNRSFEMVLILSSRCTFVHILDRIAATVSHPLQAIYLF